MCWNNVKRAYSTFSLTKKLTILYSISAFLILLISCLILYWTLIDNLEMAAERLLNNQVHIVEEMLKVSDDDIDSIEQELVWEPSTARYPYMGRLINEKGDIIVQTKHMDEEIPIKVFNPNKPPFVYKSTSNHSYLCTERIIELSDGDLYMLQMAVNISLEQQIIKRYTMVLIIVLITGIILSGAMGALVARRGLRPLIAMTDTIEKIRSDNLQARLNAAQWPEDLQRLAHAFNDMLNRLQKTFGQLSMFSHNIAHELRTPINNIMGATELVLTNSHSHEEIMDMLHSNMEECHKLAQLIDRLLFLARAEDPKMKLEKSVINIAQEINSVLDFYDAMIDEQQICINVDGDGEIAVDNILFRRVITNILSNAIRHSHQHGKIDINIHKLTNKKLEITIKDDGEGIASEHLEHLFDRFYRVDSARSKAKGGTGLGLAIVKTIMELHQGHIHISSEAGVGTVVSLVFPI